MHGGRHINRIILQVTETHTRPFLFVYLPPTHYAYHPHPMLTTHTLCLPTTLSAYNPHPLLTTYTLCVYHPHPLRIQTYTSSAYTTHTFHPYHHLLHLPLAIHTHHTPLYLSWQGVLSDSCLYSFMPTLFSRLLLTPAT